MSRHVFDGTDAHGAERKRHAEFFRRLSRQDLTVGMLHARQSRRGQGDRHTTTFTQHGAGNATLTDVFGHPLAQANIGKGLLIAAKRALSPGARFRVVVEHFGHPTLVQNSQILDTSYGLHWFSFTNLIFLAAMLASLGSALGRQ